MPHRPTIDPPPRMKRWLDLTIHHDQGLTEGEAWWINDGYLVLVCPEQYAPGDALEVRIDLGGPHGAVDTHAVVVENSPRRRRRGYVHCVQWLAHSLEDRDRVLAVVAELTPTSPAFDAVEPDAEDVDDPTTFDLPPPALDTGHPDGSGSLRPQYDPGPPPSVYVAVDSLPELARHLAIIHHEVRLVLPRIPALREDTRVTVALRLPSGMFVQFDARVEQHRRRDMVLAGVDVPADTRMVLHELVDRAAATGSGRPSSR
ncbi:MAG: hypothetical protein D6798_01155 [Deltaproteobacteria bacterium]|nr:MAG: hypothetical protein D6798_01155 [Deltaproteobacteria bacterium]